MKSHLFQLLLVLLALTLPTIGTYYFGSNGMYECHDSIMSPVRLYHLGEALKLGIVMPNWLPTLASGFGSPIFLFSWFLPYYLGVPLHMLGLSLLDATKVLFLLSWLASGVAIYLLARRLTSHWSALAAVGFYLLAPFHLNATFTRCSLGESWALVLVPLIFFFLLSKTRRAFFLAVLSLSALALTHNLDFIFTLGLLGLWAIFSPDRKRVIVVALFSLGLSCFFWLPALAEQSYLHYPYLVKGTFLHQFPTLSALFNSPWQYGPPLPEDQIHSLSFQLGKIHWLIIATIPLILWRVRKKVVVFLAGALGLSIFLQLKISLPVWDAIQAMQIIVFPWRLQLVTIFAVALLAAFLVNILPRQKIFLLIFLALLLIANRNHFYLPLGDYGADSYIAHLDHDGSSWGEYLPLWVPLGQPREKAALVPEFFQADKAMAVTVDRYYFPGWRGYLDGKEIVLWPSEGKITFWLPPGQHRLTLVFGQTPIRQLTTLISAVFALCLIGLWAKKSRPLAR
ncbi:MAG: hypothetical protein M1484_01140 [Patescibacteria group bacterium]|nr:hypothetical protein [Patescibacteria group bacterium]MCL5431685.1 hypothetical protein [Patescibacteria group bacterium]